MRDRAGEERWRGPRRTSRVAHSLTPDVDAITRCGRDCARNPGDAALAAVRAFSLNGYESTTIDDRVIQALGPDIALARRESCTWDAPAMSVDIEWNSVLPDSSVRVRRGGSDEWRRSIVADGFRGDALIYRRDESDPDPVTPFQA